MCSKVFVFYFFKVKCVRFCVRNVRYESDSVLVIKEMMVLVES